MKRVMAGGMEGVCSEKWCKINGMRDAGGSLHDAVGGKIWV